MNRSLEEYGPNKRQPDGKDHYCRQCRREYDRADYQKDPTRRRQKSANHRQANLIVKRQRFWALLATLACTDCGLADPEVLEFDHVRGEKKYNIGVLISRGSYSWQTLLAEIEKCDPVCANCHRRRTNKRSGWWRAGFGDAA